MSSIPTGWSDDGTNLVAPNGHKVIHGFRDFVLSHNWDKDDVPLEDEHGVGQVLLHNTALGGGTRQCFRDSVLWWTAQKGVICEQQLGLELFTAYQKILPPDAATNDLKAIAQIADKYK